MGYKDRPIVKAYPSPEVVIFPAIYTRKWLGDKGLRVGFSFPFVARYLKGLANVILLSVKCYITFGQMLYYFWSEVILLSVECYITFGQKLYYF